MSQYDEFAANYHWLYSDYVSSGKPYLDQHQDILKDAGPKARILDCSCGIGTFVIALAKLPTTSVALMAVRECWSKRSLLSGKLLWTSR
jgi:2-polyprenyl-3-methyl-5-hydroxy-6-metoxy-1,4-benzoquinol methylase